MSEFSVAASLCEAWGEPGRLRSRIENLRRPPAFASLRHGKQRGGYSAYLC